MRPCPLTIVGLSLAACTPTFEDRPWLVDEPRIVAISATPAEARPAQLVQLDALVVDPEGMPASVLGWSACTEPRSVRERGSVSEVCTRGEALQPLGNPAAVLGDACARFGPNPPPAQGDEPPRRPADPDASGGYFLPVRAQQADLDVLAFGFVRLRCDLAGVTRPVFDEYQERYTENLGPTIESIRVLDDPALGPLDPALPARVAPGEAIELELRAAPGSAETYVVPDEDFVSLVERRESLTVRWYVTDGELSLGEQRLPGSQLGEGAAAFAVQWQAPSSPTRVHGWAVLEDDRGGVSWSGFTLDVG